MKSVRGRPRPGFVLEGLLILVAVYAALVCSLVLTVAAAQHGYLTVFVVSASLTFATLYTSVMITSDMYGLVRDLLS